MTKANTGKSCSGSLVLTAHSAGLPSDWAIACKVVCSSVGVSEVEVPKITIGNSG